MDHAVSRARQEALKSTETFRLGAALVRRRAVVGSGRNRNVNSCGLNSIHAEMDAVWKYAGNVRNTHLVVVRLLRDGHTEGCSKPCEACARALEKRGIRKVTYTTGDPRHPLATVVFQ